MNGGACLYPGSFDPVTCGHMDVIRRCAATFDTVIVGVLNNPDKVYRFPVDKRVEMLEKACDGMANIRVISFGGLLADLARKLDVSVVVRGVRGMADLEYEMMMARINRQLNPGLETVFLPASPDAEQISSSMVRQLAAFGADIAPYVPSPVLPDILAAFSHTPTNS